MPSDYKAETILAPVDEAKNKTSLRSSSLLLRMLLVVGGLSLFMGLLIFAVLATILYTP